MLAGLTVYAAAFTWAVVAVWLCFGPVAALWTSLVGGLPSIVATLGSLIVSVVIARRLLRLGDRLMHGADVADMDSRLRAATPPASVPYDWVAHNRQVIRAVRQAHYCRTQQFDRLAALEREEQAERARAVVPDHDVATPTGADSAPWRRPVASWLAPLTMCWLLLRVLVGPSATSDRAERRHSGERRAAGGGRAGHRRARRAVTATGSDPRNGHRRHPMGSHDTRGSRTDHAAPQL